MILTVNSPQRHRGSQRCHRALVYISTSRYVYPIMTNNPWPFLVLEDWQDTLATLHMWTQIVGKIRLATTPLVNHWWNVPLYVSARGLTTSAMPYEKISFEIEFDFIEHMLTINCSDGGNATVALKPKSVAVFYREVMAALQQLGIEVRIWKM